MMRALRRRKGKLNMVITFEEPKKRRQSVSGDVRRKHKNELAKIERQLREHLYKRWYIKYQWKTGHCTGNPRDWKSWRAFAVVPILFRSEQAAKEYMDATLFKNMSDGPRKNWKKGLTASIEVRWLKEKSET